MIKNSSFLQPSWQKGNKKERFEQIRHYFERKSILDIGCTNGYHRPDWIHRQIVEVADGVVGMDIEVSRLNDMKKEGFNVVEGDATNFNLDEKFDVIHAGELIEHIDNFHGFLTSCHKHLKNDGVLILTTPNALRISNFIYSLTGKLKVNEEHTCWFCETTLATLLRRNGFEPIETDYLKHTPYHPVRKLLGNITRSFLPKELAWNTLLMIAKKQ